uniref:carbohydrate-binding protein n=1 Tax=Scandinavium goeteborgense TaxID=1851514 RepID=UPI00135BA025|nr:carbohydrate-binding protein [Scandinavium goeteborgense]
MLGHAALRDAASEMPDISQKKILVAYWYNWGTNDMARGYQGGLPSDISLREVPKGFNVVNVSFMKVMAGQSGATYRYTVIAYDAPNILSITVTLEGPVDSVAAFTLGKAYAAGDKLEYNGKIYRCLNTHTAASHRAPDRMLIPWAAE